MGDPRLSRGDWVVGGSGWVPSVTIMATRCLTSLCEDILRFLRTMGGSSVVAGVSTGILDINTALLYELAFTAMRSVSGYCCEVKQR